MPSEVAIYVADKLFGGVVSYAVRMGADTALNTFRKRLEDKKEQEALRRVITLALQRFEREYPELARSLFDETFIESRGIAEVSKLLMLSVREVPDTKSLARAFREYFTTPIPHIEEACAYFLLLFREEVEAAPEFADIVTQRLTRDTAGRVEDIQGTVNKLLERVKALQLELSGQSRPVFEARVEGIVNNGICNEDRIVIRNVGAPISQVKVQQLLVFKARLYDMRSNPKIIFIRSNGYYPGSSEPGHAQGEIYSTLITPHRMKMMNLIEHARKTDINGHLALVDFDRLLAVSYRDRANEPCTFNMRISEFGYEEVSPDDFKALLAASSEELFDFYSMNDDVFIEILRRSVEVKSVS
jgi:hypothetical protein